MNETRQNLLNLSKYFKNNTPKQKDLYVARQNNTLIWFFSQGCRYSQQGLCLMCNYGKGECIITKENLKKALDEIFKNFSKDKEIPMMLFGTNGSIFDEYEMPEDCFEFLLDYISNYKIKNIYFETFYTTVTQPKLEKIQNKLKNSNIFIELGFESASKEIREKALLKFIDNELFIEKIKLIHSFSFFATANILLGIPFLTERESFDDTINSIKFLTKKAQVDEIVVFPLNIKKDTLLKKINHSPMHLVSILELIKKLDDTEIRKVNFSWFDIVAENSPIIKAPISCDKCFNKITNFIGLFMKSNKTERIKLRDKLTRINCQCEREFLTELKKENNKKLDERIFESIKNLKLDDKIRKGIANDRKIRIKD